MKNRSNTVLLLIAVISWGLLLWSPQLILSGAYLTDGDQIKGFTIRTGDWPTATPTFVRGGTSITATLTAAGFRVPMMDKAPRAAPILPLSKERTGVRGKVCVRNTGDRPTENLHITVQAQFKVGAAQYQVLASSSFTPTAQLQPGQENCYPYEIEFVSVDEARYRSAAAVTITNHSGWMPGNANCPGPSSCPFGPEPKADFTLPHSPDDDSAATPTATRTLRPTHTPTRTATATPTPTQTRTASPTPTRTRTVSPTPTRTRTVSPTPRRTRVPPPTPTPKPTCAPSPTRTPTPTRVALPPKSNATPMCPRCIAPATPAPR